MLGSEMGAVKPARPPDKGFRPAALAQIRRATKYGLLPIFLPELMKRDQWQICLLQSERSRKMPAPIGMGNFPI